MNDIINFFSVGVGSKEFFETGNIYIGVLYTFG